MRVAMVGLRAPWGTDGGVERVVAELAPRLVEQGCEVRAYCRRRYNPFGSSVHEGVQLRDAGAIYSKHLEAISHTARVLPEASRWADVVHIHATGPSLLAWVPRLAGRATVVTVHGLDWQRDKWNVAASAVLRAGAWTAGALPHRTVVVSRALAEHYAARGVGCVRIENGVAPIGPLPLEAAGVEGLEPRRYLLYLGRLVPEKGLETLFEAWGRARMGTRLQLLVVGGDVAGEYGRRLRAAAPDGVRFLGPLHGTRRDALLCHARALVSASRLEGLPLAPLEAMSAGAPVWLSGLPAHAEVLGDARAGRLVAPGAWAAALEEIAALPDEVLAEMGMRGRGRTLEHFGWDRVTRRTLEVYREAMRAAGG